MDPRILMQLLMARQQDPRMAPGSGLPSGPAGAMRPAPSSFPSAPTSLGPRFETPNKPPGRGLFDQMFGDADDMAGLLSAEDRHGATKQSMLYAGTALLSGGSLFDAVQAGQQGYTRRADSARQGAAMAKVKQQEQARAEIFQRFPPQPGETTEQTLGRLQQMLPMLIQAGDPSVGSIVELLKSQGSQRGPISVAPGATLVDPKTGQPIFTAPDKTKGLESRDLGTTLGWFDPQGNLIRETPKGIAPGQSSIAQQRSAQRENSLAEGYQRATNDIYEAHQFVNLAMKNVAIAKSGDGAAQVEMLYAFIKAMDPASVVREGEVALARSASPLWSWAQSNVEKIANKSAVVPPLMIQQMADLMQKRLVGYETRIKRKRDLYITRAKRQRISDADDLFDMAPSSVPAGVNRIDDLLKK